MCEIRSGFITGRIICPFFRDIRNNQTIVCEGVKPNTALHLTFNNKLRQRAYIEEFCCDKYKQCRISRMLYEKYEEAEQ